MRRREPGFTLIELLIVIAVISILTGLLVIGVSKMSRTMKAKATGADLENIQGFFDEMNAHGGMNTSPVNWLWRNVTYSSPEAPVISAPAAGVASVINFWKVPNQVSFVPGVTTNDALNVLGSIADTDGSGMEVLRNGSQAVLNTQLAMRILLSYPANKAAMDKLPPDRKFIPYWVSGSFSASGADGLVDTTVDNGADDAYKVAYAINNCVKFQSKNASGVTVTATFRCIKENEASATTQPPAPGSGGVLTNNTYWQQDDNATPLILDAWGNPLIFVPATGLINVYSGTKFSSDSTLAILLATPASNYGAVIGAGLEYSRPLPPIQSPDNRPYFMSAGPDGDLTTGDDNIYSFSK